MLISSINFVNRGRSEKHRREKGDVLKDKSQDFTYCKKQAERIAKLKSWKQPQEANDMLSNDRRTNENDINSPRTSGYGSSASVTSYDVTPSSPTSLTDRVSITTVDEYNLFIDPSFYFVTLRKQKQITKCSSFSRRIMCTEDHETGGRVQTVQLCLSCDPNYFLITNAQRQLDLKLFHDDDVTLEDDERLFTVHESLTGQTFIQPSQHKGYYLHHLDGKLSVTKLELHLRPPEEYVFYVHSHGDTLLHSPASTCTQDNVRLQSPTNNKHSESMHVQSTVTKDNNKSIAVSMETKEQCRYHDRNRCSCDCVSLTESNNFDLSDLNSDVIKLGNASATVVHHVTLREKHKGKTVQAKRRSFYNMVSLTGSCFGFGQKTED